MNHLQSLDGVNSIKGLKALAEKIISLCEEFSESEDEAKACIEKFVSDSDSEEVVPLNLIKALRSLIRQRNMGHELEKELELLISSQVKHLHFTPIQSASTSSQKDDDKRKYIQRIERLKILVEENRYRQITSNLDKKISDDATVKSMMYATSVGLNMIVAPLSFGAFMYFFSGALLDRFFISNRQGDTNIGGKTGPDIRRVIAGVISGVMMLFIEMILFVIRNHEMDSSVRKKSRTRKENPFGYSKARSKKTFT